MAGLPLGAPAPLHPASSPAGATHCRINASGAPMFYRQGDDPHDQASLWALDRWATAATQNRGLEAAPFERVTSVVTRSRRRTFAAIPVACGEQLTVQASRRARECAAVQLLHGIDGEPDRMAHLLLQPATARMLARALIDAAAAVDQAQRSPVFTRGAA